jgi:hypothetical protein
MATRSYSSLEPTKYLKLGKINLSTIQSIIVICCYCLYCHSNNFESIQSSFQNGSILVSLSIVGIAGLFLFLAREQKLKLKAWHFLVVLAFFVFALNYSTTAHAQILEGIDGAIDDVGTAAGGTFATTVLDAVIDLIRIAVFIAVAGAVIAGIIFGVTQGQWQAPVLVVGVIIAIGLFLEIMGTVVFG